MYKNNKIQYIQLKSKYNLKKHLTKKPLTNIKNIYENVYQYRNHSKIIIS